MIIRIAMKMKWSSHSLYYVSAQAECQKPISEQRGAVQSAICHYCFCRKGARPGSAYMCHATPSSDPNISPSSWPAYRAEERIRSRTSQATPHSMSSANNVSTGSGGQVTEPDTTSVLQRKGSHCSSSVVQCDIRGANTGSSVRQALAIQISILVGCINNLTIFL